MGRCNEVNGLDLGVSAAALVFWLVGLKPLNKLFEEGVAPSCAWVVCGVGVSDGNKEGVVGFVDARLENGLLGGADAALFVLGAAEVEKPKRLVVGAGVAAASLVCVVPAFSLTWAPVPKPAKGFVWGVAASVAG